MEIQAAHIHARHRIQSLFEYVMLHKLKMVFVLLLLYADKCLYFANGDLKSKRGLSLVVHAL